MKQEVVHLSEYLQIGLDLAAGKTTPEEGQAAFDNFFAKLVIKPYIKHKEKIIHLAKALFKLDALNDEVTCAAYLEMARVTHGLLPYCVNLDNDVDVLKGLYVVYDAIRENGLYDYILRFCKEDYQIFSQMLTDAVNIGHIQQLLDSVAALSGEEFEKWEQELRSFKDVLTPELLSAIIEFNAQDNSAGHGLTHELANIVGENTHTSLANLDAHIQNLIDENSEDADNTEIKTEDVDIIDE